MPTVSKSIADEIIAHNGVYPGDEHLPPCVRIVKYRNCFDGNPAYGLEYEGQEGKYAPSKYVIDPKIYWRIKPERS